MTRFDEVAESLPEDASEVKDGVGEAFAFEPSPNFSEEMRQSLIEEGRRAAQVEFEAAIDRERAEFNERLQAERKAWVSEEGNRLAEQIVGALRDFQTSLDSNLERILEPFVIESVRRKILSDVIAQLRALIADRERPVIQLSGPMDLLEAICAELSSSEVTAAITDIGGIDVKARIGATLVETSMEEWLHQLRSGE